MTTTPEPDETAPLTDLEMLAAAIRGLDELRTDMRAAAGVGRDDPLPGLRGTYDRQIVAITADVRRVYNDLLGEAARRWARQRPGTIELILPEGETLSGP